MVARHWRCPDCGKMCRGYHCINCGYRNPHEEKKKKKPPIKVLGFDGEEKILDRPANFRKRQAMTQTGWLEIRSKNRTAVKEIIDRNKDTVEEAEELRRLQE